MAAGVMGWDRWQDSRRIVKSPYIHWALHLLKDGPYESQISYQVAPPIVVTADTLEARANVLAQNGARALRRHVILDGLHEDQEDFFDDPEDLEKADLLAVPKDMTNPRFVSYWKTQDEPRPDTNWVPATFAPATDGSPDPAHPTVDRDDIIVGIIDIDIALGHRRFRRADGSSRVLAAWQQGARFRKDSGSVHLPFGQALFRDRIDALLTEHSGGALDGVLDQDGFNRAAGLVSYERVSGPKGLSRRSAHGTHVMDLSGGVDLASVTTPDSDKTLAERVKFLVVNLPSPMVFAEGGAVLDGYLIYAYNWLIAQYKRIVEASALGAHQVPFLVNISFGKQAGSKDAVLGFPEAIVAHVKELRRHCFPGFSTLMPAGNDHMTASHAELALGPQRSRKSNMAEIGWRIIPDDQTSNFLEIWAEPQDDTGQGTLPIGIDIVPPGAKKGKFLQAQPGQIRHLRNDKGMIVGSIYAEEVRRQTDGPAVKRHFMYQVCLAPDTLDTGGAPAGLWHVRVKNYAAEETRVRLMIQTDQATLPGERVNRRSYFEEIPENRVRETLASQTQNLPVNFLERENPRSRILSRGTMNAYAVSTNSTTVAGFRFTDGRPAPYSAGGLGPGFAFQIRRFPNAALPSDDGYAHFGVLASGAQEGSIAALRGTSFACAQATRCVIDDWLHRPGPQKTAELVLNALARPATIFEPGDETDTPVPLEKSGDGHVSPSQWLRAQRVQRH